MASDADWQNFNELLNAKNDIIKELRDKLKYLEAENKELRSIIEQEYEKNNAQPKQ